MVSYLLFDLFKALYFQAGVIEQQVGRMRCIWPTQIRSLEHLGSPDPPPKSDS